VAVVGHRFHRDYGPVLRAVLFAVDRRNAREVVITRYSLRELLDKLDELTAGES